MINKAAEIAFLILIFSLAFMQPDVEWLGPAMTLTEPVFLVTAGLFALALVTKQTRMSFDRIYILFAVYGIALLLSAGFSVEPRVSLIKLAGEFYLIAIAVLTVNIIQRATMMKWIVMVWLAASGASALIATTAVVFYYLGISNLVTETSLHHFGSLPPGNYPRLQGTFLYPSLLCNYLSVSWMLLLAARRCGWIARWPYVFFLVIFSITIAFTLTPGIGGVLLATGLWYGGSFRQQGRRVPSILSYSAGVVAAIAFLAVSAFTIFPASTSPYHFVVRGMRIDPTQRLLTWSGALQTFFAHPFFGKGLGLAVADVYFMPPSGQIQLLTDAHNTLLSVAAQAGLLAVIAIVMICVSVVRRTLPLDPATRNVLRTALGIAFISAFVVQGLVGSFEDTRHLWLLIGLIVACRKLDEATTISP